MTAFGQSTDNPFDEWATQYEADIPNSKDKYPFSGDFNVVIFLRDKI